MKLAILTIGRLKSRPVTEIASDYLERLGHYVSSTSIVAKDEQDALSKLASTDILIVFDERGKEESSQSLADFLADHQQRGTKRLVFFYWWP